MIASVNASACDRSPGCPANAACPRGAFQRLEGGPYAGAWIIEEARCTGCGACVRACRGRAVSMTETRE